MKKNMSIRLHWKYAVKINSRWVAVDDDGNYYLTSYRKIADTKWDIRGAKGIYERYIAGHWNKTMGTEKPEMNIVKIHRPQKLNLVW